MLSIDRRLIKSFDWITFLIAVVIVLIGIMTIYSATRPIAVEEHSRFYLRQTLWLLLGVIALFLVVSFNYIWLSRFSLHLYIVGLLLLLAVFVFGKESMGAQRWLSLGPISFQPSEFFKVAYLVMLSKQLSVASAPIRTRSVFLTFLLVVFLPVVILIKQPDLGMALIILLLFLFFILLKGLQRKVAILFMILVVISMPFLGEIFWEGLRDYQKSRLVVFLEPEVDPEGVGYHISQSKITIGSGEFFGKGYLKGTQGPFRFLPEKHTDFIFAVFAEEWGFLGSLLLLLLYLTLLLRGLDTARNARDDFGRLLALGITIMFSIYFVINVGMTMGIMPLVGIPLPFMSYGGTALLTNFISLGILINIRTRRLPLF